MNATELVLLRKESCSFCEMARALGLHKSTYQRYENGTAKIPEHVAEKVMVIHGNLTAFMAAFPQKFEAMVAKQFPNGIISEGE